jgi:hypothetical protein
MPHLPLLPLLNRVGKRVFVEFFEQFNDVTLPVADVVSLLPREFTLKSRRSRTSKARRIIREGLVAEALTIIAESNRVEPEIAERARLLLGELHGGWA